MKKIAIIDDDIYIGNMLEELLRGNGYDVLRAYSGTESLYLLSQNKPDLVLLMENPKQVIAKSVLLDRISLDRPDCTERSLKQRISNLRKKLQDVSGMDYIETVWGIGFKLAEQKS